MWVLLRPIVTRAVYFHSQGHMYPRKWPLDYCNWTLINQHVHLVALLQLVNKLVSLTWLLWALRSFQRFTLHYIRGHPFMTSTRRGVRLRWTHVDGGEGSSPMWTSTQKIKIRVHWCHTVFSCKEVGVFFARISSLDRKKWKFFCDIN